MVKFMNKLRICEEKFLVYSLMFTTTLIFFQVIMRYVIGRSLSWSEELTRYIFLWQIWVGASYAISMKKHLKIDVFINKFNGSIHKFLQLISLGCWFFFSAFLAVEGTKLVILITAQGQLSPAMQVPMSYSYAAIPVGGVLMLVKLMGEVFQILQQKKESK